MSRHTIHLTLHKAQMEVFNTKKRFRVVVAGRRTGKCLYIKEKIAMADGSYRPVEDVAPGDLVLTLNEDTYALESRRVEVVADNGVRDLVRVVLRTGEELKVTPNHPILANNTWIEAGDLQVGDLVAVPRHTVFGNETADQAELDFLAVWLADGDHNGFTKGNSTIVDIMKAAGDEIGINYVHDNRGGVPDEIRWRWRGNKLWDNGAIKILEKHGLRDAKSVNKFIPEFIFRLNKVQLARFLNIFISCDGCITPNKKAGMYSIQLQLANEQMLRQFANLLLKFGIRGTWQHKVHKARSSVTGKPFESWNFIIAESQSVLTYCDEIGSVSKGHLIDAARKSALKSRGTCNSYLPISHDEFTKHMDYVPQRKWKSGHNAVVARDLPTELRGLLNSWRKQTPSRVSEYRYRSLLPYSDGYFDPLLCGDFAWVEVKSVEACGEGPTIDLQIEGNHNFIAENIVTHNTVLSIAEIIRASKRPNQKIWYVAPTYRMAKDIVWEDMKKAFPSRWVKKVHETYMIIWLKNGTMIQCKGAEKSDNLRGVGLNFVVLDEVQDITPDAWYKVLRPTLSSTGGSALFTGSPKSFNLLFQLYQNGQNPNLPAWASWQFPTITSPFIPQSEIDDARAGMDPKSFSQEYEAQFNSMSGKVYYAFDRTVNVGSFPFNPRLPIWVGQDFNIDPMSSVILQPQPSGQVWVVDEIILPASSTTDVVDALEKRYWRYANKIVIYPDASGANRQHARGESDLDIFRERGFGNIVHHAKNPNISDRVNAVNRMFKNARGESRLFIDRSCTNLIESVDQTIYKPGSRDVNKKMGTEHAVDALGYAIEYEFPMRKFYSTMGISI